jgi:hypothetical protein
MRFSPAADVDVLKLIEALRPYEKAGPPAGGQEGALVYQTGRGPSRSSSPERSG